MIEIRFDETRLTEQFARLIAGVQNASPLMRIISGDMMDEVEDNFKQQGRPKWLGLSRSTLEGRVLKRASKKGKTLKDGRVSKSVATGSKILIDSGQLVSSIHERNTNSSAIVSTNKVYAAIHQFGGPAGRELKVIIPDRPFLNITPSGEDKILRHTSQYLQSLVD